MNVFTRTWWTENASWPNGLEPNAGNKHYLAHGVTEAEARTICKQYNDSHEPGRYSCKAEFED